MGVGLPVHDRSDGIPTLLIICGLPGTGKTTLAKQFEANEPAVRLCPDEWMQKLGVSLWDEEMRARIESIQADLAGRLLELKTSVIIEWGTWGRDERIALAELAHSKGAMVELHWLHVHDPDELWKRIQKRNLEAPPIERHQLDEWIAAFQEPQKDELEAYDEVFIHNC